MAIRISPKHGVNPSVMLCFFCNESIGVALLGRLRGGADAKAPRQGVYDYEPCQKCKDKFEQGTLFVGVETEPCYPEQVPMGTPKDPETPLYPTGAHAVLKSSAAHGILGLKKGEAVPKIVFVKNEVLLQFQKLLDRNEK